MAIRFKLIVFVFLLALSSILLSISKGSTPIPFYQLFFEKNGLFNTIFLQLRLPRTLTAFVSGGLLALAGSLMQLLLQNPLADPYVLGISGGAALVTLLMMLLGLSGIWLIGGAWFGSLAAILLICALARRHLWQPHSLLLTGVALASGFGACISFILIISPNASLHSMLFWLMGDLNDAAMPAYGIIVLLIGMLICFLLAPGFNLLYRGDSQATSLGLNSKKYRMLIYFLSSLFTATAVTLSGCIGFVGLIVPHITRKIAGLDHRMVLPVSLLLGGTIVTLADTLARTLIAPQQLPVGMLLALIGVPVFMWLMQR